jgi:predicted nucleotidyltransferase
MDINGHDIIAKILVGSRAYGTEIEGSDWDYKGVYIQDPLDLFLNGQKNFIKVSEDEIYYELGYFANLCLNQNPTILEMLYAPEDCVVYSTEHWRRFINKRDLILSKKARHAYKGYITKEIKELTRGPKQAAHISRLFYVAVKISTEHTVVVRLEGSTLNIHKHIRAGTIDPGKVGQRVAHDLSELDTLFDKSTLRENPDTEKILEKVLDIKKEYFKRYDNTRRYSEDLKAPDVR